MVGLTPVVGWVDPSGLLSGLIPMVGWLVGWADPSGWLAGWRADPSGWLVLSDPVAANFLSHRRPLCLVTVGVAACHVGHVWPLES